MASRISSGLVMSVVIILLALEYSGANCDQGNLGTEAEKDVFLQSENKFLLGRKMLQEMNEKTEYIPGKSKPEFQTQQQSQESDVAKRDKSAFLEAADEVVDLMRKDYRGMGKRKPPINNHEPKD